MAYADKQAAYKYNNDFQKEKYDRITIVVPKGTKEDLTELATKKGYKNLSEFMKAAIDEKVKKYKK